MQIEPGSAEAFKVRSARINTIDTPWLKPRPNVDLDNAEFWAGLREHKLLLWRCFECGEWYWPKAFCRNHSNKPFAEQMSWEEASGYGTVFVTNVHRWAFDEVFREDLPYVLGLIKLNEGPLISSTIMGPDIEGALNWIGRSVEIEFEDHPAEEFTLPRFRLT